MVVGWEAIIVMTILITFVKQDIHCNGGTEQGVVEVQ